MMGSYGKNLSERFKHVGKKQSRGYCVICGEHGKLVWDHVPPQGAITISKTEQHLISEISDVSLGRKIIGIPSPNGSKFRTICQRCNGDRIGSGDDEVKRVHGEIASQVVAYYQGRSIYPWANVRFDLFKYMRAMVGHILSATSSTECQDKPEPSEYFDPLKDFVLHGDESIFKTHDFYYWFYPYERHLSAKMVGFYNNGVQSLLSLLSFHPVAFMVVQKGTATYPAQASKLEKGDEYFSVNISISNVKYSAFPFVGLEGNQFYMLTDYLCTTSRSLI